MKLAKLKAPCRKYGISAIAMLSLLVAGTAAQTHHVHADQTEPIQQTSTGAKPANIASQSSADKSTQPQTLNESSASSQFQPFIGFADTPVQEMEDYQAPSMQSISDGTAQSSAVSEKTSSATSSSDKLVEPFSPSAFQEASKTNTDFVKTISPTNLKSDLSHLIQSQNRMPQASRESLFSVGATASPKSGQSAASASSAGKTAFASDPAYNAFQQFLHQVKSYANTHVSGQKTDVRKAEDETIADAESAMNKYLAKQKAKLEAKNTNQAEIKKHQESSEQKLMAKFHKMYAIAKAQLGKPYAWGGNGSSVFDCSGFTKFVYYHGMHRYLPRTAGAQYAITKHIPYSKARLGDLLFFGGSTSNIGHVGIYLGHGLMIDAQLRGVIVEHVKAPWWHLVGVGRVVE